MIVTLEKFDQAPFISTRQPGVSVRGETILRARLKMRLRVNGQSQGLRLTVREGPPLGPGDFVRETPLISSNPAMNIKYAANIEKCDGISSIGKARPEISEHPQNLPE